MAILGQFVFAKIFKQILDIFNPLMPGGNKGLKL